LADDEFLEEEGILREAKTTASNEVIQWLAKQREKEVESPG
jgi:hypothetical protein